jgi:hypothetical protein
VTALRGSSEDANDADFQERRDNRDWTMKKYATWDPGELLPYRFEMERHVGDGRQFLAVTGGPFDPT